MSAVPQFQDAIAKLPDNEFLQLAHWIHGRQNWEVEADPEVMSSVERGERQLDAGQGKFLEDAAS